MSNLKNYTSKVPAVNSISMIERKLVEAGSTDISKKYENETVSAIRFRMLVNGQPLFFELPAKKDACYRVMLEKFKSGSGVDKKRLKAQSERTAWKITLDWVEIQLSMIKMEQVEPLQVFLGYVWDPATDETFYSKLQNNNFRQLTNG
jgi:hypothetical protein